MSVIEIKLWLFIVLFASMAVSSMLSSIMNYRPILGVVSLLLSFGSGFCFCIALYSKYDK